MIYMLDSCGRPQECKNMMESCSLQPKTMEVFWSIYAIGYDGIRRNILFALPTKEEMHRKYEELREEYDKKILEEISESNYKI